jgi:hypothetical protein
MQNDIKPAAISRDYSKGVRLFSLDAVVFILIAVVVFYVGTVVWPQRLATHDCYIYLGQLTPTGAQMLDGNAACKEAGIPVPGLPANF